MNLMRIQAMGIGLLQELICRLPRLAVGEVSVGKIGREILQ